MIFFFPTATQWQICPVLMAAVAFAAPRIGFVFSTWIKEGNGTGDSGRENGFRLLATERTQTPNTNRDCSVQTSNDDRKRPDVLKKSVAWSNNVFHRRFRKEFENNMQVSTEPEILTDKNLGDLRFFDYIRRLRVANTTVKNQSPDTAKRDQHSP